MPLTGEHVNQLIHTVCGPIAAQRRPHVPTCAAVCLHAPLCTRVHVCAAAQATLRTRTSALWPILGFHVLSCVQNPEIRQMAEQMASDPSFQAITQQLAGMGLAPGAPGMPAVPGAAAAQPADSSASTATANERSMPAAAAGGAGASAPAGAPGAGGPVDPEQYMKVRVNRLSI